MTHREAEALIQPLVAAWTPDPVSRGRFSKCGDTQHYCIGGIICKELVPEYAGRPNYPAAQHLASILRQLNRLIAWDDALFLAHRILEYNDRARYADAWDCVRMGLSAQSEAQPVSWGGDRHAA